MTLYMPTFTNKNLYIWSHQGQIIVMRKNPISNATNSGVQ